MPIFFFNNFYSKTQLKGTFYNFLKLNFCDFNLNKKAFDFN